MSDIHIPTVGDVTAVTGEPTRYVAPDAPERASLQMKEFAVPYEIKGTLKLKATDAHDAYLGALMFSKNELADRGALEMDADAIKEIA